MLIKNKIIVSSTSKFINKSPSKFNKILFFIRNKKYYIVLNFLKQLLNDRSLIIWKTVYSAISNAVLNYNLKKNNLKIREAFVNQGPILKRKQFRAKGNFFLIQKKMSHLTIKVSNI
jgi:large subunit ribosomal protein L22